MTGGYRAGTEPAPARQPSLRCTLLFAALSDLIICRTTKVGLLIPCAVEGHDVDAILAEKVPKVKDDKRKKWLVGAIGGSD